MPLPRTARAALTGGLQGISRFRELQLIERLKREAEEREFARKQQLAEENLQREIRLRKMLAEMSEEGDIRGEQRAQRGELEELLGAAGALNIRGIGAVPEDTSKLPERDLQRLMGVLQTAISQVQTARGQRAEAPTQAAELQKTMSETEENLAQAERYRRPPVERPPAAAKPWTPTVSAMNYANNKGEQMANAWLQQQVVEEMRRSKATKRSSPGFLGFGAKQVSPEEIGPSELSGSEELDISRPETRELWFAQFPEWKLKYEQIKAAGVLQGVGEYKQLLRLYGADAEIPEAALRQSEQDEVEPTSPEELPTLDEVFSGGQ